MVTGAKKTTQPGGDAGKVAWTVTGMYDGWRLDTHHVTAKTPKEAKDKVRKMYKNPRKVTYLSVTRG